MNNLIKFLLKFFKTHFILLLFFFIVQNSKAVGYIEQNKDGKTIIHVTVQRLPDPESDDFFTQANYQTVKLFIKNFPKVFKEKYAKKYKNNPNVYGDYNWDNVEIQLHNFSGIYFIGVESDLLAIAGGVAPDILYVNFNKSYNYINSNFLYPLDEYFTEFSQAELRRRIDKRVIPVIYRAKDNDVKKRKHYWALPYGQLLSRFLLYRKDLFQKNNIPYPNENWTWDDFYQAAKKIHDPDNGVYGVFMGLNGWQWTTFLWSSGGNLMKYSPERQRWYFAYDSEQGAIALDFYIKLLTEKWIDKNGNVMRGYAIKNHIKDTRDWELGKIGMFIHYISERNFKLINPQLVGTALVPKGPTGKRGAELNSRMYGIFSGVKSKAVRDAAWEYIKFLNSDKALALNTKLKVNAGVANFVPPEMLKRYGYNYLLKYSDSEFAKSCQIAFDSGVPEPYGKNSSFIYPMLQQPIQEAEELSKADMLPKNDGERLKVMQQILATSVKRANELILDEVPPKEMCFRRAIAGIVIFIGFVLFIFMFNFINKSFSKPNIKLINSNKQNNFKKNIYIILLLAPAFLAILIWRYIPLVHGSLMSLYDYQLIGKSLFIGIDNFANTLFSPEWWLAVWTALRYCFLSLTLTFIPPLILAVMLQEVPRCRLIFRIIYYIPAMLSGIVTIMLWKQFLAPSRNSVMNKLVLLVPNIGWLAFAFAILIIFILIAKRLYFYDMKLKALIIFIVGICSFLVIAKIPYSTLFPNNLNFSEAVNNLPVTLFNGLSEPFAWRSDSKVALLSCIIPMVWATLGPGCLIYLAALKGIPDDYYEAADIDGANFIDKIIFIVLPNLKALLIINFVGAFISSWYTATENIMIMTGGAANSEVAGLHIWLMAFNYLNFGKATAMAWILGFMLISFTVYQLKILSNVEFKTTKKD
ncbi:extracellular solute-binding protein [Lentisphaerota bacterium WC36G]|nr:extracellular solute-binding protein [Lentisphaerae bacterium WC36]